ncbi:carboxypeptidase-like regulatory domain-containing protein [Actinokineospora enzanensis]|uniref:carboxypeptidase-like regulatory domain-containing protein n=1 Tax=Actinokineospora enzanensis TaxID=155975 RepID=UPI0003778B88|nr:carboxypeptidase-like regulatory domain-containing protein [Actinokineospora enzanensis]
MAEVYASGPVDFAVAMVTGTVRDRSGRVIPDATATLVDTSGTQVDQCACPPCGHYWLATDAPGSFLAIWSAARCEPRTTRLDLPPGTVHYDVTLLPHRASVAGTVSGPAGALTGVTVRLVLPDGELRRTVTDELGRYLFEGLHPGEHVVDLPGHPSTRGTVELVEGERRFRDLLRHDPPSAPEPL